MPLPAAMSSASTQSCGLSLVRHEPAVPPLITVGQADVRDE
jgi:hypothetical protein